MTIPTPSDLLAGSPADVAADAATGTSSDGDGDGDDEGGDDRDGGGDGDPDGPVAAEPVARWLRLCRLLLTVVLLAVAVWRALGGVPV